MQSHSSSGKCDHDSTKSTQLLRVFCLYVSVYFIGIILMIHRPTICFLLSGIQSTKCFVFCFLFFEANNLKRVGVLKLLKVVWASVLKK